MVRNWAFAVWHVQLWIWGTGSGFHKDLVSRCNFNQGSMRAGIIFVLQVPHWVERHLRCREGVAIDWLSNMVPNSVSQLCTMELSSSEGSTKVRRSSGFSGLLGEALRAERLWNWVNIHPWLKWINGRTRDGFALGWEVEATGTAL